VSLPSTALSAQDIAASPAWFPLEPAGPGAMRLVRLDETAYRSASFLDRRLLQSSPKEARVDGAIVASAAATLAPGAHYLFHTGHVGSTLVSRLVGEYAGFFCVREPALLRELALQPAQGRAPAGIGLRDTLALLARTWRAGQRAVVKATSFASELAEPILDLDRGACAVLMFTPALAYLRCIMGGPNSRVEAGALAPSRLARLRSRLPGAAPEMDPRSEGEWIAMSWLCEMLCLREAAARFGSRTLWVDFDAFLGAPEAGLVSIFRTFGTEPAPAQIAGILSGPLMRRYSKAPEHAYDAALRRDVLAGADREHGAEIRRGMEWLARLARRQPLIGQVLAVDPGP
jgi:hypothetical protein